MIDVYPPATRITDEDNVLLQLDPFVHSIPTTDTFHHLGHEGKVFIHSNRHNGITTNLDTLIRIPAASATRQVHMRYQYTASATVGTLDVTLALYKDTIVSADGTSEIISSTNDAVVLTSGVLIFEGPTITSIGTEKATGMIVGEKRSASSKEQMVPEYILAPNGVSARDYTLRATVNGGATVDITTGVFFYDTGAA